MKKKGSSSMSYKNEFNYLDEGYLTGDAPLQREYECWAIVGCDVAEAKYMKNGGVYSDTKPSVQHLIDCKNCDASGLHGGSVKDAWFFMQHFGVAITSEYPPRTGRLIRGDCRECQGAVIPRFTVDGFKTIPIGIESIMSALVAEGPLAITILVETEAWDNYRGGITKDGGVLLDYPSDPKILVGKHYVTLVGFRHDSQLKYWILRHSAGPQWGDNGLMRLDMAKTNCFMEVLTPINPRRFDIAEVVGSATSSTNKKRKRGGGMAGFFGGMAGFLGIRRLLEKRKKST